MSQQLLRRMAVKFAPALWLMAIGLVPTQAAVESWVQRYNHTTDSYDSYPKVVTDSGGNVIMYLYKHFRRNESVHQYLFGHATIFQAGRELSIQSKERDR